MQNICKNFFKYEIRDYSHLYKTVPNGYAMDSGCYPFQNYTLTNAIFKNIQLTFSHFEG